MTERSGESGGLSSGDPLRGPEQPPAPAERPGSGSIWSGGGYGPESPPPPGAGGVAPTYAAEPAAGRLVLADWWRRAVAQLIDGLIIAVGALVVLLVFGAVFSVGFLDGEDTGIVALVVGLILWVVAVAIAGLLSAPWLMTATNGKTLGRMATRIRVVRTDGQRISFGFAMLREVAVKALLFGIAGSLTVGIASLLDWLWPLWDEENRALHDFIVNTRTVID
jgi:uncharacterized RDD family membrane protein YckC